MVIPLLFTEVFEINSGGYVWDIRMFVFQRIVFFWLLEERDLLVPIYVKQF